MKYVPLGSSNVDVSRVCLGSMTWGLQNNQQQADEQINYALEQGVNFIDTAEMYPVPPSGERYGHTELIIGDYLSRHLDNRENIILATKIAGSGLPYLRGGADISGETVISAVDDSLTRLKTDYIDLFQLHWPNRPNPHFAKHHPNFINFTKVNKEQETATMLSILEALDECVKAGKIRFCGLSDDTPWGIHQYLTLAKQYNLPKMMSIQNEFNLLHNKDWPYLIETCVHEDVAFLPWSPLAGGALSGKYLNGERPEGSRWTLSQRNGLFRDSEQSNQAIKEYCDLANDLGITPSQLALAWCDQVDGVSSTIIGATNLTQLKENISAFTIELTADAKKQIANILKRYPAPF